MFFLSLGLQAQLDTDLPPVQLKSYGEQAMEMGDYYTASEFFLKYNTIKTNDVNSTLELANAYFFSRDYRNAKNWYLKTYQLAPKKQVKAMYKYAQCLKMLGKYEAAIEHFTRFKNEASENSYKELFDRVEIEIAGSKQALEVNKAKSDELIDVNHLKGSANGPHIELSPILLDSITLMYSSFVEDSVRYYSGVDSIVKKRQVYSATKSGDSWNKSTTNEYSVLNDSAKHVGNTSISKDKQRLYFTKCELKSTGEFLCDLYISKKEDGNWSAPVKLPAEINNGGATQPAIEFVDKSIDLIYFVSDREGSVGGKDIWTSTYNHENNIASEVVNLGKNVNTNLDEITPYYLDSKNILFFSSNGWEGFGGFDVFKTKNQDSEWLLPENIGYPLNGSTDDVYYSPDKDNLSGFLVSNRDEAIPFKHLNCCDDIFQFNKKVERPFSYLGKLYNSGAIDRILDLQDDEDREDLLSNELNYVKARQKVMLYQYFGNEQPVLIDSVITEDNGEFTLDLKRNKHYKLVIESDGFFNKHHKISTVNIANDRMEEHIGLLEITREPIIIKNIYYPFDEWYLTDESKHRLDTTIYQILLENPKLIVELSSHTDNFGTDSYNDKLSQKRAESVVDYLIKKGINKKKLRAKGYGERQPIAPNSYSDGADNPEGRQRNRRTEFRVIGIMKDGKEIIYKE